MDAQLKETRMDLINLLVFIIIFGLIFYAVQNLLPLPAPFRNAALLVVIVVFVLYLLGGLHLGHPLFLR